LSSGSRKHGRREEEGGGQRHYYDVDQCTVETVFYLSILPSQIQLSHRGMEVI